MAAYAAKSSYLELAAHTAMFLLGATLHHSNICIVNDIFDRKFDRQVGKLSTPLHFYFVLVLMQRSERTKDRPLAAGVVTVQGAWALFATLLSVTIALGAFANQTT